MKELVLTTTVEGLGHEGDVVQVAEGYARNYLLPRNLGLLMTPATRHRIEKMRERREKEKAEALEQARKVAAHIESTSVTLPVKTGEQGKLFGSVGTGDIAEALKEQGVEVDRQKIELEGPIRQLGVFNVTVKLHPDVDASLKIWVVEE